MATTTAPTGFGRAAWTAIRHGQQMNGIGLTAVTMQGVGATKADGAFEFGLFVAPPSTTGGMWKVEAGELYLPKTTLDPIPIGNAAHNWGFKLAVYAGGTDSDLGATTVTNNGSTLAVDQAYGLSVSGPESATPKKVFLEEGNLVAFQGKVTGDGGSAGVLNLNEQVFIVTLYLRQTPPGR